MLNQANVVKTVQQYTDAVLQAFQPEAVILYGSYTKVPPVRTAILMWLLYLMAFRVAGWSLLQNCGNFAETLATISSQSC